jgi:hypothetical protein
VASASLDFTIKLWAFEPRQLLVSFDDTAARHLVLSPDLCKLAYTNNGSAKIYICDIPPDILASVCFAPSVCIHPCLSISRALISFKGTCKFTCWRFTQCTRSNSFTFHHPSHAVIIAVRCNLRIAILLARAVTKCHYLSPLTHQYNLPTSVHFHRPPAQTPSLPFRDQRSPPCPSRRGL